MSGHTARQGILNYLTGRAVCSTPRPAEEAEGLLDAHTAEVAARTLREGAALLDDHARTLERNWGYSRDRLDGLHEGAQLLTRAAGEKAIPAGTTATPALTVYQAEYDSIAFGLYTTAAAAREHCEAHERRDQPTAVFAWIEDEEDSVAELVSTVDGDEQPTGYVVTALEVASAYDEEADE